ncbi:hypothetical protein J4U02_gp070 [Mycobacterium phage Aziz]|uniref:Uncharacterized protein n=1 Tax=Mycobacterium phage Aziz TaxID=2762281 RepID=A0A7G8LHK8_9CAUD|nr:hypothetical protein J4U02_gp070 [Mycobacterium phage Aziz]ASR75917.1 hypothetical protein SEA_GENEVAB15_71 [Mycobacterium phage GenevaB15]QNJ56730.1 hypothetical protein SEA_AZIZ_70 [Mycobacterium phage Aziz]
MTTILRIAGPHGPNGFQGDDGVEHYNSDVETPHGNLGQLHVHREDEKVYLTRTDPVVLVRRGFPDAWDPAALTGVAMVVNPLGFTLFRVKAENGFVIYRLLEDDLRWEDDFDGVESFLSKYYLGILVDSNWTFAFTPPEVFKHETITRQMQMGLPE